jgi:hypothetical protein
MNGKVQAAMSLGSGNGSGTVNQLNNPVICTELIRRTRNLETCPSVSSFISKTTKGISNKFLTCWRSILEAFGGI